MHSYYLIQHIYRSRPLVHAICKHIQIHICNSIHHRIQTWDDEIVLYIVMIEKSCFIRPWILNTNLHKLTHFVHRARFCTIIQLTSIWFYAVHTWLHYHASSANTIYFQFLFICISGFTLVVIAIVLHLILEMWLSTIDEERCNYTLIFTIRLGVICNV